MRRTYGFTYLIALFVIAAMALFAARLFESSALNHRRDLEAELLFVGAAYQHAIKTYYWQTPGTEKRFPPELAALLGDDRLTRLRRPLRRLYRDPLAPERDWGVIRAADGGIRGVYSRADGAPLKSGGFGVGQVGFAGAQRYSDWQFVYIPSAQDATDLRKTSK